MRAAPSTSDPARDLRELISSGQFQAALALYRSQEALASRQGEAQLLAATAAARLGDCDGAEKLASMALERYRHRADDDGQMRAQNLIGAVAFERGRLAEAEHAFQETLRLANQLDDALMMARAGNNLGSVAHLRGRPEVALGLYRGALLAYQRLGDRRGVAETCHNLCIAYRQLGQLDKAEDAAAQSLRHAELVGERGLLALAVMGDAEVRLERGDLVGAGQRLDRARRLVEAAGDEIGSAEVGRLRALLALRSGTPELARHEAEAAYAAASRFGSALLQAECAAVSALALRGLGLAEGARQRHVEAIQRFQRLGAACYLERCLRDWHEGGAG